MSTESHVMALLEEGNPATELPETASSATTATTYLTTLQQRSSEVTQLEPRPTGTVWSRRNRLIAAAAVFLVIIGTAVFVLTEPSEDAPVAATDTAVMAVKAAIDAYNGGDIEAYVAAHVERDVGPSWEYQGETRYLAEVWMNANRQATVMEPCRVTVDTFPKRVECLIALEDDWLGPAGLNKTERFAFRVNSDLKIVLGGDRAFPPDEGLYYPMVDEDWGRWEAAEIRYAAAFWEWLQREHPDVYTKIKPAARTGEGGGVDGYLPGEGLWIGSSAEGRDPGDMLIALQYVDEFIAQSDDYPIDSSE